MEQYASAVGFPRCGHAGGRIIRAAEKLLGAAAFRFGEEFSGCTFFDDVSLTHKDNLVGYFGGEFHFVGNDEHAHALACQLPQRAQWRCAASARRKARAGRWFCG